MTISTQNNTYSYTGNGVTTAFSFPRLFYEDSHLVVTLDGVVKTITTHYTVSGAGSEAGGTVTFLVAPATGVSVVIQRIVPFTQETDFENFDGNPADVTEEQFDLLAMMSQQLAEAQDRTPYFPVTTDVTNLEIPEPTSEVQLVGLSSGGFDLIDLADLDTELDTVFTGLAANDLIIYDGTNWTNRTPTQARDILDLEIGTNVQAYSAGLTQIGALADPNADRILFWDDSAGAYTYLAVDSSLTITNTTLSVTTPGAAAATQAEQETGSSTSVYVSPGRQQYHASATKAWCLFTSITTTAITVQYNIASLTDNGVGDTTVNFTTAFSTANYSVHVTGKSPNDATSIVGGYESSLSARGTSSVRIKTAVLGVGDADMITHFAAWGDQ